MLVTTTNSPELEREAAGTANPRNQLFRPARVLQRFEDWLFGYDFFISYRWSDGRPYAESLAKALGQSYSCFLDSAEYAGGDDVVAIGNRALRHTECLVLVATRGVAQSIHVKRELKIYRESHKQVVAIDFAGSISHLRNSDPDFKALLTDNELYLSEEPQRISKGPSARIVSEVSRSLSVEAKRFRRRRAITAATASFVILLLLSTLMAIVVRQMMYYESARRQLLTAFSAQVRGLEQRQLHVTIDNHTQAQSPRSRTVDIESLVLASNTVGTVRSLHLLNCELVNVKALSLSTELVHLNLYKSTGLDTLGFLGQMPEIEVVQLDETSLTDEILNAINFPDSVKELKLSNNFELTSASVSRLLGDLKSIESLSLFGCAKVVFSQSDVNNLLRHAKCLKRHGKSFDINLNGVDLSRINTLEFQRQVDDNNYNFRGITRVAAPLAQFGGAVNVSSATGFRARRHVPHAKQFGCGRGYLCESNSVQCADSLHCARKRSVPKRVQSTNGAEHQTFEGELYARLARRCCMD